MTNKKGEHFRLAMTVVFLSIIITIIAFISENNKATGFATFNIDSSHIIPFNLNVYKDVDSLQSLAAGAYYISDHGIVYWLDDSSKPAIAYVNIVYDIQKNREIYINRNGDIGYIIK